MSKETRSPGEANPVTRGLIHNALEALVDEMMLTVERTGHSLITKDYYDFSCAVLDRRGQVLEQGSGLPVATASMPDAMQAMLRTFEGDLESGDVLLLNDPFDGGTHLPDFFVFRPIFYGDNVVGFSGVYSHHVDIGGRVPGGNAFDSTEIYEEGLRLPPLKIYRRGVANDDVLRIIQCNVRDPKALMGDLRAQMAAAYIGELGVLRLVQRYGVEKLQRYTDDLLDYTERLARAEIARWPGGDYQFTDYVDDDGLGSEPLPIRVTLRIRGDALTVDFSGTSLQVNTAINSTRSWVKGVVYTAVRFAMETGIPNNEGFFRPIEIITPKGTLVNLQFPAACTARVIVAAPVADATFGALAKALPDRIAAASDGQLGSVFIGGRNEEGHPFLFYESISNAWGGRPTKDGIDGLGLHIANISQLPVERIEAYQPVRVEEYSFFADSGGAGKYRGGLGVTRSWRFLEREGELNLRSGRRRFRPYGLSGGKEGTLAQWTLVRTDGREEPMPGMFVGTIRRGELVRHRTPGAGGWGNPYERDVEAVLDDVQEGKVTVEHARLAYGVEIDPNTFQVDTKATDQIRRQVAAEAKGQR